MKITQKGLLDIGIMYERLTDFGNNDNGPKLAQKDIELRWTKVNEVYNNYNDYAKCGVES